MRRLAFASLVIAAGLGLIGILAAVHTPAAAQGLGPNCSGLLEATQLKAWLGQAAGNNAGGLFQGTRMWAAVVNREGEVCAATTSTDDPTQVWPGSRAIARGKAYTANAFSLDVLALSTARLYTFTQPGHSLWSLGQTNQLLAAEQIPPALGRDASNQVGSGLIFFGGGVPLYHEGKIIGGLGVSGDTSCTDHEIAKRVRDLAGLNPPGGSLVDDIVYPNVDGPSVFGHPLCVNTFRNSQFLGNETPAAGY